MAPVLVVRWEHSLETYRSRRLNELRLGLRASRQGVSATRLVAAFAEFHDEPIVDKLVEPLILGNLLGTKWVPSTAE